MFAPHVLAVLAVLSGLVPAQGVSVPSPVSTETASATVSSTSGTATIPVTVGLLGHFFDPKEIRANVGDIIEFRFYPRGHRVIRAEYQFPCIPYEYANVNKAGFDSGFFDVQVALADPPNYQVRVNTTEPIFFYCGAPGSCVDYKMIGVINANATQTFAGQLKVAEKVTYQLVPGEPFPTETASIPGATNGPGSDSGGRDGENSGLSPGAIAGIAIGAAAVLIIAAVLLYLCGRRGGFDSAYRKSFGKVSGGGGGDKAGPASPPMAEANYTNAQSPSAKSPSAMPRSDHGTLRHSAQGQPPYYGLTPSPHPTPSPGPPLPQYGLAPGQAVYGLHYPSPHSSPAPNHYHAQYIPPPPVELPSQDVPMPARSPPPGYAQGHESWVPGQEGQYRPGGKP